MHEKYNKNKPPTTTKTKSKNTRALIFDSMYDNYKGAIPYVRVFDGILKPGMTIQFFSHGKEYDITETGHFILEKVKTKDQLVW